MTLYNKKTKRKRTKKRKNTRRKKSKCGGSWARWTKRTTGPYKKRIEKEKMKKLATQIKEIKKTTSATSLNPTFRKSITDDSPY